MTTSAVRVPPSPLSRSGSHVVLGMAACGLSFAAALAAATSSSLIVGGVFAFTVVCAWLFLTEKYEYALIALMLYLGVADGFIRLKTGEQNLTLVRDVLLYALVAGVLARQLVAGKRLTLPPMAGWVLAFVAVVLIQILNPLSGTLYHSAAGLRQHLEWVPLFFLAYATMRTSKRLRVFLLLLCAIAAINGAVSFVQFHLTPEQLASWGPGYADRVNGSGTLSSRTFRDDSGILRNRPPALGSDMGFGGIVAILAAPAVLGLIGLRRRHRLTAGLAWVMAVGVLVAIATSQARVAVVGSVLASVAFIAIAALARRSLTTLASTAAVVALILFVAAQLTRGADPGAFQRYDSISTSPGGLVTSTYDYRSGTFALLPKYMAEFPLGAGLGTVGQAAEAPGGGPNTNRLAGETQPSFLALELGIPGLLLFFGFAGVVAFRAITRIPQLPDPETRLMVTAVAAALLALLAAGAVGSITTSTPGAPFFWFATGTLAYWVGRPPRRGESIPLSRTGAATGPADHGHGSPGASELHGAPTVNGGGRDHPAGSRSRTPEAVSDSDTNRAREGSTPPSGEPSRTAQARRPRRAGTIWTRTGWVLLRVLRRILQR